MTRAPPPPFFFTSLFFFWIRHKMHPLSFTACASLKRLTSRPPSPIFPDTLATRVSGGPFSFEHVEVKSRVIVKRIFASGKYMQPYTEGSLTVPIIQRMLLPVLEDVV